MHVAMCHYLASEKNMTEKPHINPYIHKIIELLLAWHSDMHF